MKRVLAGLALVVATAALSGCYYDPGYSYVRPVTTYGGDAYYGNGVTYDYAAPSYYYPSYGYYGGYGCCYAPSVSVGIGGVWYSGHSRYYGGHGGYYGRGYYGRGYDGGGRGGHGNGHGGSRGSYHGHWNGSGH